MQEDCSFAVGFFGWMKLVTITGIFNRRNQHFYATENTHLGREIKPRIRFSVNVWRGMLNNQLIEPFFIQGYFKSLNYLHFLQNVSVEMLGIDYIAQLQ